MSVQEEINAGPHPFRDLWRLYWRSTWFGGRDPDMVSVPLTIGGVILGVVIFIPVLALISVWWLFCCHLAAYMTGAQ